MPKILKISATEARKDFFNLIDLVSKGEIKVQISKRGLEDEVVLQRKSIVYKTPEKSDIKRVHDTAGAIETSGYEEDEMEIAKKEFAREYIEKNPKGKDV